MHYTVILMREETGWSVSVPAMPGCFSQGDSREAALANVRQAMELWLESEAAEGRGALDNSPEVVARGVGEALEILEEMRAAGEVEPDRVEELELARVALQERAVA